VVATVALLATFLAFQVAAAVLGALAHVADVLLVFLVAWALSYLLEPAVAAIDRGTRLDRTGAVIIVYVAIGVVLALLLALGVPAVASQLAALTERGPEFGQKAAAIVVDVQQQLDRAGVRVDIVDLYGDLPARLAALTGAFAADALGVVAATGNLLFNVTLVLIIAFLMLVWSVERGATALVVHMKFGPPGMPPTVMLDTSQMAPPAGMANTIARHSTMSVRSITDV